MLSALELELYAELPTISLYPEVLSVLTALRSRGLRLGVCSNLAAPYAIPVKALLPFPIDAYAWSFDVGATKPDREIYAAICSEASDTEAISSLDQILALIDRTSVGGRVSST